MPTYITKQFRFESAHFLPNLPDGHKCRRMHGHSFVVDVTVVGEPDAHTGIIMDFSEIKEVVRPLIDKLDHWVINEIGEKEDDALLKNPTSENLARWFYDKLSPLLPIYSIIVHETCTSRCEYRQ